MRAEGLLALRGQPPQVQAQEAEEVAARIFGIRGAAAALNGERDRNFRMQGADGRQFVLKFIDPEADDVIVAGQSAALAHIAAADPQVPVPRTILTLDGNEVGLTRLRGSNLDCRVRLVTYLTGKLIQQAAPASAALLNQVGRQTARLDRALAGFSHPALRQSIAWDIRHTPTLLPLLPKLRTPLARDRLAAVLATLDRVLKQMQGLRSQAIHGDCHGKNLLVNERADECVGIIDLGDMIHAPLALEIAVTMAEFLTDGVATLDALTHLIAGYTAEQPLERQDVEALYDLVAIRIALGVLIQTWRDQNGADESPPANDLEDMSARALAELTGRGRDKLTQQWLDASGSLLQRRHKTLGANAELSYDRPLHLVRGEGVWVFTSAGEKFLDVYNNVPHVGHAHPVVVDAISKQARLIASNTRYLDERIIEYVERLTATLPPDLNSCLFVNSGSEANDIAWRIAKSQTGRDGALVMKFAYHGITDAITALSPAIATQISPHIEQLAAPTTAEAAATDVNAALKRLAARNHSPAALLIDSALTSTGIFDPPVEWIEPIAAAVRKAGGLIIADEVQFGLGRSGSHFWGFARRGYHPDIVTLGKPVGNGFPLGVVITRRDLLEKFQKDTGFFSTFGGNPVAAAAGLAVLEVMEKEKLQENARSTGDYFINRLRSVASGFDCIRDVRGRGLMVGVEVTDKALTKRIVNGLRERGVLIGSEGPLGNILKLRPPMPFRPEHADIVADAISATLSAVHP